MWLIFVIFSLLNAFSYIIGSQQDICVWLSGASYCDKFDYYIMNISGPATGFELYDTIYDPRTDLQGFIGILHKTKSIYVVFRGSSSPLNWIYDIELKQVPYDSYSDCQECMVHKGFYHSAMNVQKQVLLHLHSLKLKHPFYNIVVTGHSYGAAVSQLIAMEVIKEWSDVEIFNFGQPRIGNTAYASLVNQLLQVNWRFVHDRDIVPHLPPGTFVDYFHSCQEVFEDDDGILHLCNRTKCEDIGCSNKYKIAELNTQDHLYYLGHRLSCKESVSIPGSWSKTSLKTITSRVNPE